jgi:transcriptional regulator with XRE-family HTH domain
VKINYIEGLNNNLQLLFRKEVGMDNQKIGKLILELRKSKNLTQKGLADILNVTDKAVSKWERGAGYPEITLIPSLAEALGISASELLCGELTADENTDNKLEDRTITEEIVSDVIEYTQEVNKQKSSRRNEVIFISLSAALIAAVFICMLCNFVINRKFDWSLYVLGSEITVWLIITPLLLMKKHRFLASMAGLTVSILPLLMLIEYLCPVKNWVFPFAVPIVMMSLAGMWVTLLLFLYTRVNRAYLAGFSCLLLGVVLNLSIHSFVQNYLKSSDKDISNQIVAICFGFLAVGIFLTASIKKRVVPGIKNMNK